MDIKNSHEKILIVIALIFCAGILFYNAFFIPEISVPAVIYVDSDSTPTEDSENTGEQTEDTSDVETNPNSSSDSMGQKVNINTASAAVLAEELPGIGPALAQKIVDYRTSVGNFKQIEEIMNVSGIGEKMFEKFKDMICV